MQETLPQVFIVTAIVTLIILSVIDLRHSILPNKLVALFAVLGLGFHFVTQFSYLDLFQMIFGCLAGAGLLLFIRTVANRHYKKDTLGLGDVKLMGAAGLWLGIPAIFVALSIGAFIGLLHGLGMGLWERHAKKQKVNLGMTGVPAGVGFAVGIFLMGLWEYYLQP